MTSEHRVHGEDGFTLIELLAAVVLLGIIVVPLSMSVITGIRVVGKADQKFTDSRSSLVSSAYFANDVANANTVFIPGNPGPACGTGTLVVSFLSSDPTGATDANYKNLPTNVASYMIDSSTGEKRLVRYFCANGGTPTSSVIATRLGPDPTLECFAPGNIPDASCQSARWVKLSMTATPNSPTPPDPTPTPYTFTLEGTRRPK
jgi:prepilin-type N-terminal cleavage/methylation domain-containing protein